MFLFLMKLSWCDAKQIVSYTLSIFKLSNHIGLRKINYDQIILISSDNIRIDRKCECGIEKICHKDHQLASRGRRGVGVSLCLVNQGWQVCFPASP